MLHKAMRHFLQQYYYFVLSLQLGCSTESLFSHSRAATISVGIVRNILFHCEKVLSESFLTIFRSAFLIPKISKGHYFSQPWFQPHIHHEPHSGELIERSNAEFDASSNVDLLCDLRAELCRNHCRPLHSSTEVVNRMNNIRTDYFHWKFLSSSLFDTVENLIPWPKLLRSRWTESLQRSEREG